MRATILFLVLGLTLSALGCGGANGVTGEGKVVKRGEPYKLAEGEGISLNLQSEDNKSSVSGTVNADGTFTLKGPAGANFAPAKYKVSYTHYLPTKDKGPAAPNTITTTEVWDLTSSKTDLVLDIAAAK